MWRVRFEENKTDQGGKHERLNQQNEDKEMCKETDLRMA